MPDEPEDTGNETPANSPHTPGTVVAPTSSAPPPNPQSAVVESTPPSSQPPETFTNLSPHQPVPPRRSRKPLIIILAIFLALLLAGSVAAYFTVIKANPETKIKEAFSNMGKLDSLAFDGSITTDEEIIGMSFNGQLDNKDSAFSAEMTTNVLATTIKFNLITQREMAYIRIDGIENFLTGFFGDTNENSNPQLKEFLKSLDKTYISISQSDLSQFQKLGLGNGSVAPTAPMSKLNESDKQKLQVALENTKFFKVTKKLGPREIGGQPSSGYQIVLQAEGLKQLMRELRGIEAFRNIIGNQSAEEFEKSLTEIKQEDLDKVPFEIWLSGEYVTQIAMDFDEDDVKGRAELNFSKFNEDFQIEAPTESRPLSEILQGLIGQSQLFDPTPLDIPTNTQ